MNRKVAERGRRDRGLAAAETGMWGGEETGCQPQGLRVASTAYYVSPKALMGLSPSLGAKAGKEDGRTS